MFPEALGRNELLVAFLKNHPDRQVLFVARHREGLDQLADALNQGGVRVRRAVSQTTDHQGDVAVVTAGVAANSVRAGSQTVWDWVFLLDHKHVRSPTYHTLIGGLRPQKWFTMGSSRLDTRRLPPEIDALFARQTEPISVRTAILSGDLTPISYELHSDESDYRDASDPDVHIDTRVLDRTHFSDARNRYILDLVQQELAHQRVLVVARSQEAIDHFLNLFNSAGVLSRAITATESISQRRLALEAFRSGRVQVLFSKYILEQGFTLPEADAI